MTQSDPGTYSSWVRRFGWAVGLAAAVLLVLAVLTLWQPKEKSAAADGYQKLGAARISEITNYPGLEMSPALSPDGSRVAFVWNGPKRDNYDVYVKIIGSIAEPARITSAPEADLWPAWSPDGHHLAFVREGAVYLAAMGGEEERKVSEAKAGSIAWTHDGRWIAASSGRDGVVLVRVTDGGKRWLRRSSRTEHGDLFFGLSRDRKRLVFSRFDNEESADLFLANDTEDLTRPLRRLTSHGRPVFGLSWAEARSSLFYVTGRDAFTTRMHRLAFDAVGNAKVEEIAAAGDHVAEPSAVAVNNEIEVAYTRVKVNTNLWTWTEGKGRRRVLDWDSEETSPQVSPDGSRIAFVSNRGGSEQLWVCRTDGGGAYAITKLEDTRLNGPRWSPNGQLLAFAAEHAGNRDIFLASLDGKPARKLTHEPSEEVRPGWSADGGWVYFSSTRSGSSEIWRIGLDRPAPEKITEGGGYEAAEGTDGKTLYFTRAHRQGLWRMDLETKRQDRVLYLVEPGYWGLSDTGILYIDLGRSEGLSPRMALLEWAGWGVKPSSAIMFYNPQTRLVKKLGVIDSHIVRSRPGFSAARDGKSVVWAQVDGAESDIMRMRLPAAGAAPALKSLTRR